MTDTTHELPLLLPLSHDHPLLSSTSNPTFDVDAFLLTRPNTSLADLRSELRDYLVVLKEELVQLINDDYADFISLRTDLRGEGARIEKLVLPLESVWQQIDLSRIDLLEIQKAIHGKLDQRAALREEKTLLHLLLKVSDLVVRLENMLLIPPPADEIPSTTSTFEQLVHVRENHGVSTSQRGSLGNAGEEEGILPERAALNRAKHLGRIAAEYSQLLYHAEKARTQHCIFVDQLQKRIDRIQTTLSRDLDVVFSSALHTLSGQPSTSSSTSDNSAAQHTWALGELSECLKIYGVLERWDAAEDVFRREIVSPFVKKTIYPGALSAPLSPAMPKATFLDVTSSSSSLSPQPQHSLPVSPTTPFTPYPNGSANSHAGYFPPSSNSNPISLIDSHPDDPLTLLLNEILRFVDRECKLVIDVAEKANSARSYKRYKGRIPTSVPSREDGAVGVEDDEAEAKWLKSRFEIMGRVVWPEVGKALMDDLGTMLFTAGRPDDFQKNYTIAHAFINALEHAAPSSESIVILRTNKVYESFEKRWQLSVYFQLRWKEFIGGLEASFVRPTPELLNKKKDGFFAPQARAIFQTIEAIWSSTIFIPELAHRFWKLTLQLVARYKTWLDGGIPVRRSLSSSTSEKPDQLDHSEQDDSHLRAFAVAIADIRNLQRRVRTLFSDRIAASLPMESILAPDGELPAEHILEEALGQLDPLIPFLSSQIVSILIGQCCEPLQHVRSIPSQYRAMSSRKPDLPSEPSYFVPNALKPLREFILEPDGPGAVLQKDFGTLWGREIFSAIATKYTAYLSGMKKTEESLRRYNKSKRSTLALFSSNNPNANPNGEKEGRDEVRIRAQMVLDIETLGKDARSLGSMINVDDSEEYKELLALASDTGS